LFLFVLSNISPIVSKIDSAKQIYYNKFMHQLIGNLVSHIFIFILAGVVMGKLAAKRGEPAARIFVAVALYVLIPLFVLLTLWTSPLSLTNSWKIMAVSVIVMAFCTLLALGWVLAGEVAFRHVALPVVFMNSAYLAIPVCALLWGKDGVAYAILYNAVVTLAHFTFGVWWVSSRKSLGDVLGIPVIYATVAGIALNLLHVRPFAFVQEANTLVSLVTLPVMLLFMGYRLGKLHFHTLRRAFIGVALRMGGGWAAALFAVAVLDIRGVAAGVCVIVSAMPSAVNAYILAEHFGADAEFAAAVVSVGTVLSLAMVPLVTHFLP